MGHWRPVSIPCAFLPIRVPHPGASETSSFCSPRETCIISPCPLGFDVGDWRIGRRYTGNLRGHTRRKRSWGPSVGTHLWQSEHFTAVVPPAMVVPSLQPRVGIALEVLRSQDNTFSPTVAKFSSNSSVRASSNESSPSCPQCMSPQSRLLLDLGLGALHRQKR